MSKGVREVENKGGAGEEMGERKEENKDDMMHEVPCVICVSD